MTPDILTRRLASLLGVSDTAIALAGHLGGAIGRHLDDETLAAVLDGGDDTAAVAHLLRCAGCRDLLGALAPLVNVEPLPGDRRPEIVATLADQRVLAASLRTGEDGSLDVLGCTGMTRVQGALAVRSPHGMKGVSLRDRADAPWFEIAIVPESARRISLLVRWLRDSADLLRARALRAGRVVAELDLVGGSALIPNLRRGDMRVEILAANTTVATAWLHMEGA